jgi:hypothetical protein
MKILLLLLIIGYAIAIKWNVIYGYDNKCQNLKYIMANYVENCTEYNACICDENACAKFKCINNKPKIPKNFNGYEVFNNANCTQITKLYVILNECTKIFDFGTLSKCDNNKTIIFTYLGDKCIGDSINATYGNCDHYGKKYYKGICGKN